MTCYKNKKGLYSIKFQYIDVYGEEKWCHRYTGKNGFRRKIDAKIRENELKSELSSLTSNQDITLEQAIKEVLLEGESYMKKSSLLTSKQSLKHASSIYHLRITDIQTRHIRNILKDMNNKKLSISTIDKFYYNLHKVFEFCVLEEYIDKNPMKHIRRIKRSEELEQERAIWKIEDFELFIANVKEPMYYVLFTVLFYTGMRRGEVLALQWKDIDLINGTINIDKALSPVSTVENPIFTLPKSKMSIRKIRIPRIAIEVLNDWNIYEKQKYGYSKDKYVFGYDKTLAKNTVGSKFRTHCRIGVNTTGWVYQNALQGRLDINSIVQVDGKVYWLQNKQGGSRYMNTKVKIVSVQQNKNDMLYEISMPFPYIVLHDLRHSCISMMINNLKTQKSVVAMSMHFGHTIEVMLSKYSHLYNESEDELITEFDEILNNLSNKVKNPLS